jgi:hypothetical protein
MATHDDDTPSRRRLLTSAAAAAAAGTTAVLAPAAAAAAPDAGADAELLALCAECEAVNAAANALVEPYADVVGGGRPEEVAARVAGLMDRYHALVDRIFALPAATVAGAAATARLALDIMRCNVADGVPDPDDRLPWAACRDLIALADGGAA